MSATAQQAIDLHSRGQALIIEIEGWQHDISRLRTMQLRDATAGAAPGRAEAIAIAKLRLAEAERAFDALMGEARALRQAAITEANAARTAAQQVAA